MDENWADVVAERMVSTSPLRSGKVLLLGAADTGKTTLMGALVERLARRRPTAVVDADIGQSHIGPPTTYTLDLQTLAVRSTQYVTPDHVLGRLVGLTDSAGQDIAIGVIERWQPRQAKVTIRAPRLDIRRVRCLTLGDARIDIPCGWSG